MKTKHFKIPLGVKLPRKKKKQFKKRLIIFNEKVAPFKDKILRLNLYVPDISKDVLTPIIK